MTALDVLCWVAIGILLGRRLERWKARLQSDDAQRTIARLTGDCAANSQAIHKLFELLGNELRGGKRP